MNYLSTLSIISKMKLSNMVWVGFGDGGYEYFTLQSLAWIELFKCMWLCLVMWYCGIQLYRHFTFYSNVMLYIFFCQSLYLLNTILTHVYKCTIIVLYFIDEDDVWYKIPPLYEIIVNTTVFEQDVFLLIPLCIVVDFVWMNFNVNIHWNRV